MFEPPAPFLLRKLALESVRRHQVQVYDKKTLELVQSIMDDVKARGIAGLRHYAEKFGDIPAGSPLFVPKQELLKVRDTLPAETTALLERVAGRIEAFAQAQKESLQNLKFAVPGGYVGHDVLPVDSAGCYAPGGRFPLPSSVLMTAIPARVAGVKTVWVASPKPTPVTMAAAAIAGADGLLTAGGAQAIAALAYGTDWTTPSDVIVGPGNRYVTAAKQIVAGETGIDMLAGPSELAVLADETAKPDVIAADLLGQAEHDPDALPVLITTSEEIYRAVNEALARQLEDLPTAPNARQSLKNGFAVVVKDMEQGIELCNRIAAEHLEIMVRDPDSVRPHLRHCGGLFIGTNAAEVIGDYGAGPNHTLPTGGSSRSRAGLSVFTFMRTRTWIQIDAPQEAETLYKDSVELARIEGLEAHARAALKRLER